MARLRSPHIVSIYGAVTTVSDRLILVMELLPLGDLRTWLWGAEGPISERDTRRIVADVCAGMAFLHGKATIHGDLKSGNVLFDASMRAKVRAFVRDVSCGVAVWEEAIAVEQAVAGDRKNREKSAGQFHFRGRFSLHLPPCSAHP